MSLVVTLFSIAISSATTPDSKPAQGRTLAVDIYSPHFLMRASTCGNRRTSRITRHAVDVNDTLASGKAPYMPRPHDSTSKVAVIYASTDPANIRLPLICSPTQKSSSRVERVSIATPTNPIAGPTMFSQYHSTTLMCAIDASRVTGGLVLATKTP